MKTMSCTACGIESEACEKCPVCGTVANPKLDRIVRELTAANTFAELVNMMGTPDRQTYAPTIHPNNTYRGRPVAKRLLLIQAVRAAGFKVFDGTRVA